MHGFEAFLIRLTDPRHDCIKPMQFAFQMLIDEHQCLKRSAHVTDA